MFGETFWKSGVSARARTKVRPGNSSNNPPRSRPKSAFRTPERAAKSEFGPYVDPDLKTLPVAFISSNVVTNGNSGSSSLNAWGEVAGLSFDSNWEGVGSDYMVEGEITRSIRPEYDAEHARIDVGEQAQCAAAGGAAARRSSCSQGAHAPCERAETRIEISSDLEGAGVRPGGCALPSTAPAARA